MMTVLINSKLKATSLYSGCLLPREEMGNATRLIIEHFFYASETVLTYFFYETFIMGKSKRVITQMESGYVMQLTETCRKEI